MARIGILTCSNATQDLGCSSASCLADLRKRHGSFADYPADEPIHLVGPEKLLQRVRALTEFRIDAIHLTYCVKALCPFREKYKQALEEAFPKIRVVIGTHKERISADEFRERVKKLFCQPKKTMIDLILDKD